MCLHKSEAQTQNAEVFLWNWGDGSAWRFSGFVSIKKAEIENNDICPVIAKLSSMFFVP